MINKKNNPYFSQLLYKTKIEVAKLIISHINPFKNNPLSVSDFSEKLKHDNGSNVLNFIESLCFGMLSSEYMNFMVAHGNNKTPYTYLVNVYYAVLSYNRNDFLTKYKNSKLYQDYKAILANYGISIDRHIRSFTDAFIIELASVASTKLERDKWHSIRTLYENCVPISKIVQFYEDMLSKKELTEK